MGVGKGFEWGGEHMYGFVRVLSARRTSQGPEDSGTKKAVGLGGFRKECCYAWIHL